jgi:hypothetical protein
MLQIHREAWKAKTILSSFWRGRGFTLKRQALYCLSYICNPFYSGYFGDEGFVNYLPRLASNLHPPDLASQVLGCRCERLAPGQSCPWLQQGKDIDG